MSEKTAQVSDETRSLGLVVARGTSEQPSVHDASCRFHAFQVGLWCGSEMEWPLPNWTSVDSGFCLKALAILCCQTCIQCRPTTLIHLDPPFPNMHCHALAISCNTSRDMGLNATAQVMLICPVDGTEEIANPFASA